MWCQGYSEPGAGSDLANVATRARLEGDEWVIDGQKVWTSLAQFAQWIFVVARTEQGSTRHHGLSFLLVPVDQPGVEIRPIVQNTGGAEFNEVFFTGARTKADMVVGEPGKGWGVAMGLLGFERGVSTIGQQVGFARELEGVVALAKETGAIDDPILRDRLATARAELEVMSWNALRGLAGLEGGSDSSAGGGAGSIAKLVWSNWHRRLGEIAMEIAGAGSLATAAAPYELDEWQSLFLFTRADTIYGGSDEVQRNILAERVLGLPKEPRETSDVRPPSRTAHARLRAGAQPAGRQGRGHHGGGRCRHRRGRHPARPRGGRQGRRAQ
ncbi:acyl-CoA dehydrogenase family protein [Nocardioides alcanivorans]|uniref:acyl-CoA dehydrogenase family protein n=1 Tax=Nocardioides alcanivorans TaxID=2897352 RepID=UPI0035D6773A